MRVLFIENAGNKSAGAFHSLITLIVLLQKYGVESYVAVPDKADGIDLLEKNNIPYIKMRACSYTWIISNKAKFIEKMKMPFKYIYSFFASFKLRKYVKDNKIDLIHENTSVCYIGWFVAKKMHLPHIWHIREFLEEDFNVSFFNKKKTFYMFNNSDAIITVSNAIYDKYKKNISEKIMCRIYNGIDSEYFYHKRDKYNFGVDCKLLCVGRVCEGKGQADVIKALVELKNKYNVVLQLYIAGIYNEEYMNRIIKPAEDAGISKYIHFIGQCENMKKLYREMDIMCMASHKEAFGRVTVEAMLSGILVIGANSGGTVEIISNKETGFLYSVANYEELADKLYYVINNTKQATIIAKKGQKHAMKCYSAKDNAKKIFNLYQELLK